MKRSYVAVLSISRTVAALTVVACHIRSLVLLEYSRVVDATFSVNLFYFLTSLGHEAFVVYLVLSGSLLGGCSYRRWYAHPERVRADVCNRAIRFYSVLIPALMFGAVLDITGLGWFARCGIYPDLGKLTAAFDPSALAGNVLMLQRFLVPGLGTNAPLALVASECWAYLAFASMFMFGADGGRKGRRQSLLIVTIGSVLFPSFFGYLLVWVIGVFASRAGAVLGAGMPRSRRSALGAFLLMLVLSRTAGVFLHETGEVATLLIRLGLDVALGLVFARLLIAVRPRAKGPPRPGRIGALHWRMSRHLGDPGGTLLIMHYPLAMFTVTAAHAMLRLPLNAQPVKATLLAFAAIVLFVWICALVLSKFGAILAYGLRPRQQIGK